MSCESTWGTYTQHQPAVTNPLLCFRCYKTLPVPPSGQVGEKLVMAAYVARARKAARYPITNEDIQATFSHTEYEWMRASVQAVIDAMAEEDFCDQCAGPYEHTMERWGGHWDTCPRRAAALLPDDQL